MTRLDEHVRRLQSRAYTWPIPWRDVEQLARDEGYVSTAYQCIAGVWTLAWGETSGVQPGMRCTDVWGDARFLDQVGTYSGRVKALCTLAPNANQLGALTRLAYNIGLNGLARSTALRQHNAGNFMAAARAFLLWDKFTDPATQEKRTSAVLHARRIAEAAAYAQPLPDVPQDRMPQAIDPESSLTASPINRGAAATAVTGVVAGASAISDQLGTAGGTISAVKAFADQVVEFIGLPPKVLAFCVLGLAAWYIFKWRKRQRDEGRA